MPVSFSADSPETKRDTTMNSQKNIYMQEAISLAETGMKKGDGGPFGAVIVRETTIIGKGWNRVLTTGDPTAHAEIVAIRDACRNTGSYRLDKAEIYVNCEPCPMCLAALYWARITKLTFGASRDDAAAIGFDDARIYHEICLPPGQRELISRQHSRNQSLTIMRQWLQLADKHMY
jgi:tRNA(Arg) A34 adenosine deaminase TadA